MLKIKDDPKKLEKHLIKLNIMFDGEPDDGEEITGLNVYCAIQDENKEYIENGCINFKRIVD